MTSLVNNLGGTAGFGESSLARNDDGSTAFIDMRPIFGAQGINFFGHYYTGFYLNNNGSVTFNTATSSFTPTAITGSTSNPVIAAYWADIDTRGGTVTPSAGGTSTGSNLLWYDLDPITHTFTATWDDVGYYSSQTNKLNAFQISIHEINEQGDFDIIYRYENIDWTTGGASGGSNGLGGTPARAGYSAGNGTEYFELPQSGNQAALLALEEASNVGTPGTFVFSVRNGVPTVGVTVGDASQAEGDGPEPGYVVIPVFLTEPSTLPVTVHYSTANGTALAGQDYVAQSGTLTFAPGVTQQNILVAITGDAVVEGNETFTVTLSDPSEGASILDDTATGTIVNDDASLSIAAISADRDEGQSETTAFTFTVTRTGDLSGADSVHWAVSGPAVNGADFNGGELPSGVVNFAAGESSKIITVDVAGDTQVEGNESFTVTLSDPSPGGTVGTASATGIIHNDDFAPASLSIAATSADKAEGQSETTSFIFTVSRTGDLSSAASAQWTVGGEQVNGADFAGGELPSGVVSFAAGESSKVITIDVAGDTAVEADEAFTVTLSDPSDGAVIGTASAEGVIRCDDASLSIAATSADKPEGQSESTAFTFTVTRTGDLDSAVSAHWAVGGAAVTGADFAGGELPSGLVSFAAGESSKVITVEVAGDTAVESNEAFSVTLSNPSEGAILDTASANGVIRNDDASLSIAATSADKAEGQSGTTAFTFTVTRTGDLSGAAGASWAVTGPAANGADFIGGVLPTGVVSFAAGESSKIITIDVAGDTVVESGEAFSVTLSNPGAGTVIGTASAAGVIRNDDASLSIAATSADKAEGQSESTEFTFTVTRTGDLSGAASVHWAVTGPAVTGVDFIGGVLPSGQVSFAAGESSKVITVNVAGDTDVGSDEAFSVTLSNPSVGAVIGTASAAGVIRNDDASLSIAATSADKAEGQSETTEFTFTVTRTGDLSGGASVHWAVGGAEVDAADFAGGVLPSGVVTFAAGESSKIITIDVAGDTVGEADEAFSVTLSSPSAGAILGTASATGTIRNDDTSLSIAATCADQVEGDLGVTAFTFTVTRTGDLSGTASADWAVSGTDVNGIDFIPSEDLLEFADFGSYLASLIGIYLPDLTFLDDLLPLPSGTVSFAAGESSKTVTVWALGETVLEGDESFTVTLSNASAGAAIGTSSAVGTLRNDDGTPVGSVSISDATVTEGDDGTQMATFTVTRTGGTAAFSVDYATDDGTAMVADGDYTATSGTLHFGDGVDVQTFSVLVDGDSVFESDEIFFVDLSGATHGAILGIGTGEGTILNDDAAPGPITLVGTPGDDNLIGGPSDDIIIGLAGADILSGGAGNDSLNGGLGTDLLIGGAGADTFLGGDGDDYLLIDSADTAIDGGAGFDSAFVLTDAPVTLDMGAASIEWAEGHVGGDTFNAASQASAVYIYGDGGNDTITGSALGDYLDGGDGNDTLAGGDGDDLLFGNGGADILLGQGGDDYIIEFGGDSQIDGGAGFDSLFVWSDTGVTLNLTTASIEWVQGSVFGDDTLNGAGNTVSTFLYGWGGNDPLTGGSGDDYIAGGAGNDILAGGAGNDTLIGEAGTDRYVYTAAAWGSDTIHSFDPNGEKLDFTAVASIHSFADFTAFEWDAGNLGYNSTTLFHTEGGTTRAITLIGVQVASLSDSDFLFA